MFIVRRVKHGFFSDLIFLQAEENGQLYKRWLALDRLGSWTLKSELWNIATDEVFTLRVPKRTLTEGSVLTLVEAEAINLKSLRRFRAP